MDWMPTIEVESTYGTRVVSLATRHLMNRNIFLVGSIDSDLANNFLSQLMYLEESDEPVNVYINSPGGEVNAGLMIYDAIQASKLPINMICTGMAASMAAIIFACGQKGRRYIFPHGKVMIHEPAITNGVGGCASSIKSISDSIMETRKILSTILAKHTGKTVAAINKATSFDNTMNAEKAIKFGLCDSIASSIQV